MNLAGNEIWVVLAFNYGPIITFLSCSYQLLVFSHVQWTCEAVELLSVMVALASKSSMYRLLPNRKGCNDGYIGSVANDVNPEGRAHAQHEGLNLEVQ